jgi:hypothetical protein
MPQVMITRDALEELRGRIAQQRHPSGVMILGPLEEDSRAPDGPEEAWHLERAYGPPQRWVFTILPVATIDQTPAETREEFHAEDIAGIRVGVLTTKSEAHLRVELHGDRIRIIEQ